MPQTHRLRAPRALLTLLTASLQTCGFTARRVAPCNCRVSWGVRDAEGPASCWATATSCCAAGASFAELGCASCIWRPWRACRSQRTTPWNQTYMTREPARKVSRREQERLRQLGSRDLIPLPTLLCLSTLPPTTAASSSSPRPPPASSTPASASSSASALRSSLAAGPWRRRAFSDTPLARDSERVGGSETAGTKSSSLTWPLSWG
jgi:hypothetical protein